MQIAAKLKKIEKKKVDKGFLTNCYAIKSCLNTMSVQYQIIINKSMEQSLVSCIQQTVKVLAENYEFDYDEALALFGVDDLKFTTKLDKPKKVGDVDDALKRNKPKFPLPFTGQVYGDCCRAIVFNSGLFTQCLKEPNPNSQNSLCQTCQKQAEKSPLGNPPLGYITDRIERGDDWADPKGRRPVPYTKVMKLKKITQEEVMAEVSKYDMTLDLSVFDDTDSEKRGRKKGGKKTEVQSIFGDDEEDDGLLGALIQEVKDGESETSEKSKTSKTSSKKSKEEREAEKQEKLSQKSENDMMKAEEKRLREIKKEEDKIAKEHEKKAKEQQKEALRLLKEAKEEEKRLAKEAKEQEKAAKEQEKAAKEQEKAAKEAAKAAKEAAKADEKRSPLKAIKQEKMQQPEVVKEVEVEVVKEVEVEVEVEVEQLEEFEEVEVDEPQSPLDPPPVEEPVVEEPVIAVKPKMKKFKGPDGVSYVADANNIVYRKDAPMVRVGVLTDGGLELDDQEEEEEDLSDIE
jgi:hypothetical protein